MAEKAASMAAAKRRQIVLDREATDVACQRQFLEGRKILGSRIFLLSCVPSPRLILSGGRTSPLNCGRSWPRNRSGIDWRP